MVALGCVLAVVTMTAFLAAYVSTGVTQLGCLAGFCAVGSIGFGIVGAATLDTALRTRQYVDLDEAVADVEDVEATIGASRRETHRERRGRS